jgi:hypothetical protein
LPLTSAVNPPARALAAMAYDSRRQRLVLFGGQAPGGADLGDTWLLPLAEGATWMPASASAGAPPPRWGRAAVVDPDSDQVVLLYGSSGVCGDGSHHDLWTLSSDASPPDAITLVRTDVRPGRVSLTWETTPGAVVTATLQRRPQSGSWETLGTVRPDASGLLKYEDATAQPGARYGYRLNWSVGAAAATTPEVWVDVPRLHFALTGAVPNPARGGLTVAFSLPDGAGARLEVLDIAGRRVLAREVGALGAGDHTVDLARPGWLPPGVYLVRIVRAGAFVATRACVVQ